jgi:hypothetical protein
MALSIVFVITSKRTVVHTQVHLLMRVTCSCSLHVQLGVIGMANAQHEHDGARRCVTACRPPGVGASGECGWSHGCGSGYVATAVNLRGTAWWDGDGDGGGGAVKGYREGGAVVTRKGLGGKTRNE